MLKQATKYFKDLRDIFHQKLSERTSSDIKTYFGFAVTYCAMSPACSDKHRQENCSHLFKLHTET